MYNSYKVSFDIIWGDHASKGEIGDILSDRLSECLEQMPDNLKIVKIKDK